MNGETININNEGEEVVIYLDEVISNNYLNRLSHTKKLSWEVTEKQNIEKVLVATRTIRP